MMKVTACMCSSFGPPQALRRSAPTSRASTEYLIVSGSHPIDAVDAVELSNDGDYHVARCCDHYSINFCLIST